MIFLSLVNYQIIWNNIIEFNMSETKGTDVAKGNVPNASEKENVLMDLKMIPIAQDNESIERDISKCIQCKECKNVCENEITVGKMYEIEKNKNPICINCGQCANICPTEAIKEKIEYTKVKEEIQNSNKVVIVSIAPAVRVALGEEFGLEAGTYVEGKIVSTLRKLGADYVLDITFGADLTIMEEASELVKRIKENKNLPLFTSCCPAWVKYAETFYPELLSHLSSAKSPISMQGSIIKTYFAKKMKIKPENIVNVVCAPCTAKKCEIKRPEMNKAGVYLDNLQIRDNDYVITTRELANWIKEENIDFNSIEESEFDNPLGRGTGAGIIFGNTGGVAEAALRTAYYFITNKDLEPDKLNFNSIRGMEGIKEAQIDIEGTIVKVAIVNGMKNAKILVDKVLANEADYTFIEVMNCVGGCIAGGGQPKVTIANMDITKKKRIAGLYNKDANMEKRLSYKNPDIVEVYENFLGEPLSNLSEVLLHTKYEDKNALG
jgi:ferredoxin hydrogenase